MRRRLRLPLLLVLIPYAAGSQTINSERALNETAIRIAQDIYRIGNVTIYRATDTLTLPGRVNMQQGLIELFACTEYGKTHESVLILDVQPIHLQTALLALGLTYGRNLAYQGDPTTPVGDGVEVTVSWELDGETYGHRAEDMVFDVSSSRTMPRTHWVFTGSRFLGTQFAAQADGSLIATFNDPNAILNNPLETGGNDEVYEANPIIVPPPGTQVRVTLKALPRDRRTPIFPPGESPSAPEDGNG